MLSFRLNSKQRDVGGGELVRFGGGFTFLRKGCQRVSVSNLETMYCTLTLIPVAKRNKS